MAGIQLDLFSWDKVKIVEGYKALSVMNFEGAETIFKEVILHAPDHSLAREGMEMADYWSKIFQRVESLQGEKELLFLWEKIKGYSFTKENGPQQFRKSLIENLLRQMNRSSSFYIHPDLCSGYLYIVLKDYTKAEKALKALVADHPFNGRILGYLADSIWMQDKISEAQEIYLKALLIAPHEVSLKEIKNDELLEIIEDSGIYMTPVYGWLRNILPLRDIKVKKTYNKEHERCLKIYQVIRKAENVRKDGNNEKVIEQRKLLKQIAPEVFEKYFERIKQMRIFG